MHTIARALALAALACFVFTGCGAGDATDRDPGNGTDSRQEALAPSGTDALFLSSSLPPTLYPGERRAVQIVMRNTGNASPANDWGTANPAYALVTQSPGFDWASTVVPAPVPVGSTSVFDFVITAPETNTTFTARMNAVGLGTFGQTVSIPVTISAATIPRWGCSLVANASSIPETLAPGENRWVQITVRNSGTDTWPANTLRLVSEDTPVNRWGQTVTELLAQAVPPGATTTFGLLLKAPATPGTYRFAREMKDYARIGDFRKSNFCVDQNITVGGTPPLDAALVSHDLPSTMAPGETRTVSVTLRNDGLSPWTSTSGFLFYSRNTPVTLWSTTQRTLATDVAPNATTTVSFNVTAPSSAGNYRSAWQMRATVGPNPGYFGDVIDVPVTVSAAQTPAYGARVVSQTIPSPMTAGGYFTFSITMQNAGSVPWTKSDVVLYSVNSPQSLWSTTQLGLATGETVAPGASKTFSFLGRAPSAAGSYSSAWRLRSNVVGQFGETAATNGLAVILCGNGALDGGEECDDGNLASGDACSPACTLYCGNGVLDPGEECDDGNRTSGDFCSSTCRFEPGCGNSRIDPGENCDDGNTTNGDGCSSACRVEPRCGDRTKDPGEECDDGNNTPGDGCSAACTVEGAPPPCTQPLTFADSSVEAAVRDAIHKPSGPILPGDVVALTSLYVRGASDLVGVECLTHLQEAGFSSGSLTELAPLASLTALRYLDLSYTEVTDLTPLGSLTSLTDLSLDGTEIANLEGLGTLTNLQTLRAEQTPLADVSGIAGLPELAFVDLYFCQIVDPSPFATTPKLRELNLAWNRIQDPGSISGLGELLSLDLSNNQITAISPPFTLPALVFLTLENNLLSDVSALSTLPLKSLILTSNGIASVEPLRNLHALDRLELMGNYTTLLDISPLLDSGLGSGDFAHVGAIDCLANEATTNALRQRGVQLTVDCAYGTESYAATLVSQSVPVTMVAGHTYPVSVTLRNDGTVWKNQGVAITDVSLKWAGGGLAPLEVVNQGEEHTFTFDVTAPLVPRSYFAQWSLLGGSGSFGPGVYAIIDVSTRCGDGTVDYEEACDDSNLLSGDGCSPQCRLEIAPQCSAFTGTPAGTYAMKVLAQGEFCRREDFFCQFGPWVETEGSLSISPIEDNPGWFEVSFTRQGPSGLIGFGTTFGAHDPTGTGTPLHFDDGFESDHMSFDLDPTTGNVWNFSWRSNTEYMTFDDMQETDGTGTFTCPP